MYNVIFLAYSDMCNHYCSLIFITSKRKPPPLAVTDPQPEATTTLCLPLVDTESA